MNGNAYSKAGVTFRGALNGYNKEDVNKYIEDVNIKFGDIEADYKKLLSQKNKQIDDLTLQLHEARKSAAELMSVTAENKTLKASLEDAEADLDNMRKKIGESDAVILALNDKLDRLNSEYGELKEKYRMLTEEREEINQEAGNAPADETKDENQPVPNSYNMVSSASDSEKARMYDKISRQIGSMLIDAREIADNLISEANTRADKIILSAENKAKEVYGETELKLNHTLTLIKQTLKRMSSDCMSEYIGHMNNSRTALNKLLDDTETQTDIVYSKFDTIINNAINELNSSIEKITVDNILDREPDPGAGKQ
jgi:cell division septum initiation protein DivIVA